jgi:hypothetical protein
MPSRSELNAICVPSGDQAGPHSLLCGASVDSDTGAVGADHVDLVVDVDPVA